MGGDHVSGGISAYKYCEIGRADSEVSEAEDDNENLDEWELQSSNFTEINCVWRYASFKQSEIQSEKLFRVDWARISI